MTLQITNIEQLDSDLVEESQLRMTQLAVEQYPDLDLGRGAIHDIICFLAGGIMTAIAEAELRNFDNSRSLLKVSENPALADDTVIDNIVSNFLITREAGAAARGDVAIVVKDNITSVIPSNSVFSYNGIDYTTLSPIIAKPAGAAITGPNERTLVSRGDNNYEFTVPVICAVSGLIGNIRAGSVLSPATSPARFVTAYASADFSGGVERETTQQLAARAVSGITAQIAAGGDNIVALIRNKLSYGSTAHFSVIGFTDAEQLRDQRTVFPVSIGGHVDVFAKTTNSLVSARLKKSATLISQANGKSIWQTTIDRNELPGFYFIQEIARVNSNNVLMTMEVVEVIRDYNTAEFINPPSITSSSEAVFSRFQTATIRFIDESTPLVNNIATVPAQLYDVLVVGQPGIADIQQLVSSPTYRMWDGDILIKAAVPCVVQASVEIVKPIGSSDPDVSAIQQAVATAINAVGFAGAIYATDLAEAVRSVIPANFSIRRISMTGKIYQPDGRIRLLNSNQELVIPSLPQLSVSKRTVTFFSYADGIGVNTTEATR